MIIVLPQLHLEDGRGTPCRLPCSVLLNRSGHELIPFYPQCLFFMLLYRYLSLFGFILIEFLLCNFSSNLFVQCVTVLYMCICTMWGVYLSRFGGVCSRQSGVARMGLWFWSEPCVVDWTGWFWSCCEQEFLSTTPTTLVMLLMLLQTWKSD